MPDSAPQGRILVVDDQEPNIRLLQRILAGAGYVEVRTTTDSGSAAAIVAEFKPDLVLLDLHMPGLDGYAVLEQLAPLREQAAYLPVLVLTADAEQSARRRALEAGASDFVTKPFDADEVLLRCRNLLETRSLYRRLTVHAADLEHEVADRAEELVRIRTAHDEILSSLNRLQPASSLEATAEALCTELARSPGFDVVAVLTIEDDLAVVPLAAAGSLRVDAVLHHALPPARAARLIQKAEDGPWAAPWTASTEDGSYGQTLTAAGLRSAWYAPLTSDGSTVGLIVAGSSQQLAQAELDRRLTTLTEFSAVARVVIASALVERRSQAGERAALHELITNQQFTPVFQPIVNLETRAVIGMEALTRFADGQRPDIRFNQAHQLGMGLNLERATLAAAVKASRALPPNAFLSLNVSPDMLVDRAQVAELLGEVRRMVVLEVTEHVAIDDYGPLRASMSTLGSQVRLAIDDAGAGFASFRHILELRPDFVKLDRGLVQNIETDSSRQALVVGMRYFAQKTGSTLISEGVETEAELKALLELGIGFGQGYLLGRPGPYPQGPDEPAWNAVGRPQVSDAIPTGRGS